MRNVTIAAVLIAVFTGCQYHDINSEKSVTVTDSYLPLAIGNYWDFDLTDRSPDPDPLTGHTHREVTSIVTINHHEYYLLVNTTTFLTDTFKDSIYYRIDSDGFVYTYQKNTQGLEENRFRLNGNNKDTWSYPIAGGDHANITLTFDSLTVGTVALTNCKSYFYDVIQWVDEENTITLAPGIGFVKEYSDGWGLGNILKSARINGRVFNF